MKIQVSYKVSPAMVMVKLPRVRILSHMQSSGGEVNPGDELVEPYLVITPRGWSYRGLHHGRQVIIGGSAARPSDFSPMRVEPTRCPFTKTATPAKMDEREVFAWALGLMPWRST